ncbi:MAG: AAA family ATPase [Helicobacter sp.]|uniref:AAA family ATPase n=1 Tax=Helicobacter sp. TaxID=218 RepID=UPI0023C952A5|nr:AAA family ATPase [Helicobacter sp.]MDE5926604.1 AAA family ATPase [Helicobacter sp.]MDE7175773.1 AAA family ATPase [Helicobacter sp.]
MDRLLYQACSDKLNNYLLRKMEQDKIKYDTINDFLQLIKQNNEIYLNVFPRYYAKAGTRFGIELEGGTISYINQLSLGESVLFNMFVNIIRHTDTADEPKGIVIIDEIDTHLHANLQSKVLPQLIKMFPKIQFIITTHSPLFVLGMKEEFGDNFMLYDMLNGNIINPERFSEFQSAYTILQNTETFEKDLEQKIRSLNKPIVFVEGPTDVKYIKRACELFGRQDLLDGNCIRIDIVGEQTSNGTKSSNDVALKQAAMFLKANPNLIPNKILLLNDPENNINYGEKYSSDILFIDKMPFFDNNPIKKGVENLFPQETIEKIIRRANEMIYYTATNKEGTENKTYVIRDGCKMQVCDWLCENGTKEDFKNFESVIEILDNFLSKGNNRP